MQHFYFFIFLLKITGDHNESQILLGLELYKHRYSYSYELLFSLANFHSPLVDTERGLEVSTLLIVVCNSWGICRM